MSVTVVRVERVRLLVDAACAVVLPQAAVHLLVPQQRAAHLLACFELGLLLLEFVQKLGGNRGVVGAGKEGHGVWLEKGGRF